MKLKLEFFENQCVMGVDWTNWSADNKKEKKKMNPVLFHPSPTPLFYQLLPHAAQCSFSGYNPEMWPAH